MQKLHVGIIGLGMGRNHINGFNSHPHANVVAIADTNAARLKELGDQHNIHARYTSAEEMLNKEALDIVGIATPNKFHASLTLAALEKGCHVFCEKPMAMNADEAQLMLEKEKAVNKRIMINFSYRFADTSRALKTAVNQGALGNIYFARTVWHRSRGMPGFGGWFGNKALSGGGPLIDLGVHRLDLALWLMGYPKPTWILGSAYNKIAGHLAKKEDLTFDVEDLAAGLIKFENGATLEIEASWAANIAEAELMSTRLFGDKGGLHQYNINGTYEFRANLYSEQNGKLIERPIETPREKAPNQYHHFTDSILHNTSHMCSAEEGRIVMQILDALYQSSESGKPVNVTQT